MALTTKAGIICNAVTNTARYVVKLHHMPSITILYITISATASLNIEIQDRVDTTGFIPVKTITANSLVRLALPASKLAINITANTGTVTVTYRTVETDNVPNFAIEVFSGGTLNPQTVNTNTTLNAASAGTFKKLYQGQPASTGTTLYTVPANTQTKIEYIVISNTTGSDRTITIYHDGTTAAFNILPAATILAGGYAEFMGGILMEASDTLYAVSSVSATLTVTVYGTEMTTL